MIIQIKHCVKIHSFEIYIYIACDVSYAYGSVEALSTALVPRHSACICDSVKCVVCASLVHHLYTRKVLPP